MLREFPITRESAIKLPPHVRSRLVRWMLRETFPGLRLGYATPAERWAHRRARVDRVMARVNAQAQTLDALSRLAGLGPLDKPHAALRVVGGTDHEEGRE